MSCNALDEGVGNLAHCRYIAMLGEGALQHGFAGGRNVVVEDSANIDSMDA